jgi:hypothetical protein
VVDPSEGTTAALEADAAEPAEPATHRSRWNWRDWYIVAIITGFVGAVWGPSLIGLRTQLAVNQLTEYYPWVAIAGRQDTGHEICSGDTVNSVMPGIAQIRDQLFAGHLASWQSYIGGGSQLFAVPNFGMLDPLSLPYYVLPLWLAPAFVILLTFLAGVVGTFLYLRLLDVSRPASLVAGFVFATSGFMIMWTNWPQVRTAALIPLLFWSIERLLQRRRLFDVVPVAVVYASMWFGGFPAVTAYTTYLVVAYVIVRVVLIHRAEWRGLLRTGGLAAGSLFLGLLLAMVQMLPFLKFIQSQGLANRNGQGALGLTFPGLVTLFSPNTFGLCIGGFQRWGQFDPIEQNMFIGAATLVLVISGIAFALWRKRSRGFGAREFMLIASVGIILTAWGTNFLRQFVQNLPGFADNFIGRIRADLGFTLAALAAFGFDWVLSRRQTAAAQAGGDRMATFRRGWPIAVWVLSGAGIAFVCWEAWRLSGEEGYRSFYEHVTWKPVVLVAVALGIVVLARVLGQRGRMIAFVVLPLIIVGQATQFVHTVMPGDSKANFYPTTPAHVYLKANIGHDRWASANGVLYPSTSLYYGLRTPVGHTFLDAKWKSLLIKADPTVMLTSTYADFGGSMTPLNVGSQPILDRMGVKYYAFRPDQVAGDLAPMPATNGSINLARGAASCTIPGGPVRGVSLLIARSPVVSGTVGMNVYVTLRDGAHVLRSARFDPDPVRAGQVFSIAIAGEDLPSGGSSTVTVNATGIPGGLSLASENGALACAPVTPTADGLKLVFAEPGAIIYERLTSMPRIRWSSRSTVITNETARLNALAAGVPQDTVVLNAPGPVTSGRPGTVHVLVDDGDQVSARTTSTGAGYLTVADPMQQNGWSATVDGHTATLLPADEAMAAVAVPPGSHVVTFTYHAPGQLSGAVLTFLAFVVLLAICFLEYRRRHRRAPAHARRDAASGGIA